MNVSVVLTCHNEEAYIERAVLSAAAQTESARIAEIVVVDDGSTDGSARILERLSHQIERLQIIRAHGNGVPAARNLGIRASRSPLIAFLDGDDRWVPDKLERQLHAFACGEHIGLVYSDYVDFAKDDESDGQLVNVRRFHAQMAETLAEYFVHDGPIVPSTVIISRAVFDDVGLFDENHGLGEDTEMFLRIAERWRFQHVPGGLTYKRRHDRSLSRRLDALLPINVTLTERFADRNPELRRVVRRRLSRRFARVGHDCARHGDTALALRYLVRALGYAPLFWRPYAYLALMLLPHRARTSCLRMAKRLFHSGLWRPRDGTPAVDRC